MKDEDGEDFPENYFDIEFGLFGLEDDTDQAHLRFNKTFFVRRIRKVFTSAGIRQTNWKDGDLVDYLERNLNPAMRAAVVQVSIEAAFHAEAIAKGYEALTTDAITKLAELSAIKVKSRIGPGKRRSEPRRWTADVREFVQSLFDAAYNEIENAKQERDLYAKQNRTARAIRKLVSTAHPGMPGEILDEVLRADSPESAELAREWTSLDLPKKFPNIKVKANTLKTKTKVKAETNGSRSQ